MYFSQGQSPPETSSLVQDCLKSLAFPEMENRFHDIDMAASGTCEWLSRHETYVRWLSSHQALLWIKGKPGSGKSTLLQYALENLMEPKNVRARALILSFFFHGRGAELQKSPLGLFRSLLYQMLSKAPRALKDLVDTFETRRDTIGEPGEKWHWHVRELQRFFQAALPKVLESWSIWLFVDALDECGQNNAVQIVQAFKSLLQVSQPLGSHFRLCFSCRHYPSLDQSCDFVV